jgi:two-component system OmpR family response regulator
MVISLKSQRDRPDPLAMGIAALEHEITFEVPGRLDLVQALSDILLSLFELTALTPREAKDVRQAVLEMVDNAITWGHGGNSDLCVYITYRVRPDAVVLTVRDQGPGFDYGGANQGNLNSPIMWHGYGIMLARGLVDEFFYNVPGNHVTLVKRFSDLATESTTKPPPGP